MRIALVTESFYPAVDGTTTTVKNVVDRLVDTGHDVLLVAPAPGLTTYRGARVVRSATALTALRKPGREIRDALTDFAPDLVHVTSPGLLGRKALKHARSLGIPTLTTQLSAIAEASDYWRAKVADRSDALLVSCSWMLAQLQEQGLAAQLWAPGVDLNAFGPQLRDQRLHDTWSRSRQGQSDRVVVGYVGDLRRGRDVQRLPEVGAVPGVRLVVTGNGPQRSWLRLHAPGARLLSTPNRSELAIALASLDLLVHPGTVETNCHTLREAAASGVPVIAPATGGALDVVRPEVTGLLYDPASYFGLRDAVTRLAVDEALRRRLGLQARSAIEGRPWTLAADELIHQHYRPLVRESRRLRVA